MTPDEDDACVLLPEDIEVDLIDPDLMLVTIPLHEAQLPAALTDAEQDIALRVYAGESSELIARVRGVHVKTIGNQLESIYRKLGVGSRVELALLLRGSR